MTITLTSGQIGITDSLDMQGPGKDLLTVSGNHSSRIFYLYSGTALLDITISGLTLTQGNTGASGGAIADFDENLVLDGVRLTANHAGNDGGAIYAHGFNTETHAAAIVEASETSEQVTIKLDDVTTGELF